MFEIVLDSDQPTESPSLVLPNELLEFWGEQYLALPAITRRRLTFMRYLVYRNGGLFEKLRHHRAHRHGRSSFHAIRRSES